MTPAQFRREERAAAREAVDVVLGELERAAARGDDWYVWIRDRWAPYRRGEERAAL